MASKVFAVVGICLFVFVICLLSFYPVAATSFGSDCVMIKPSAYEGGSFVCWRVPSAQFQGIIKAEAIKLGYEPQPDGTFKKVVE